MNTVHSKSRPCTHQPTRMYTKAMFLNRGIQTSKARLQGSCEEGLGMRLITSACLRGTQTGFAEFHIWDDY